MKVKFECIVWIDGPQLIHGELDGFHYVGVWGEDDTYLVAKITEDIWQQYMNNEFVIYECYSKYNYEDRLYLLLPETIKGVTDEICEAELILLPEDNEYWKNILIELKNETTK